LVVSILVKTGVIPMSWKYGDSQEHYIDMQEAVQNFLVVIEMVFFAVAHYFVFSHKPFVDPAAAQVPCITTCCRMLDIRDVADDFKEHFVDPIPRPRFTSGRGIKDSRGNGDANIISEEAPLLRKQQVRTSDSESDSEKTVELSYGVVTFGELDSRRNSYGLRSKMIADAFAVMPAKGTREHGFSSMDDMITCRELVPMDSIAECSTTTEDETNEDRCTNRYTALEYDREPERGNDSNIIVNEVRSPGLSNIPSDMSSRLSSPIQVSASPVRSKE